MMFKPKIDQSTLSQVLALSAKNLLIIAFGLNLGIPTILIPGLLEDNKQGLFLVTKDEVSWIGSIFMASVPLGSLFSGVTSNYLGRRRSLQLVAIPFILCWVVLYYSTQIWQVYTALCVLGLFGGLIEAPFAAYVSETTEPGVRGALSTMTNVAVAIGYLIEFLMGAFLHWRKVMLYCTIVPALSFIALTIVPESPHWLIMNNKEEEARKSLAWLRGWTKTENIEGEFVEICKYLDQHGVNKKMGIREKTGFFFKKNFLWPFGLVMFVYFLVYFTGGITLLTYSVNIFKTFEVPIDNYYATLLLGVTQLLGSLCLLSLVRKLGKRVILFFALSTMGLCSLSVACYAYASGIKSIILDDDDSESFFKDQTGYEWIPLAFLVLLCFMFYFGMYIMPWLLISEVFPYETRSTGCGVCSALANVFGFITNKSFLYIIDSMYLFGMYFTYAAISFVGVTVLYFLLPETEGKPLPDITDHFKGISKLSNKVEKKSSAPIKAAIDNNPISIP
ncbi:hypothetical protein PPYR_08807 [Photinus pyralis]|nr:facilitated trehalose transporter Tret1-like isoform X3 [Photinus pyralis]XP_031342721.1 facilitated trehalose transporter Tret1-like isoform X3 [Photinus pyralis]XP_031342722.1 facilitated trehalose transporter Tret1-like isoform X3 [Photinus pyralis]XP_031342723.1 facilitated trehalose transporter Tret1-like isoform X3 [Photinus pyralis]XP_031342724.1 facilitated trehalose transporter Tret1-like isoform X3 [Photinus pyralis]XP_031342725.1 facilitated trehalose transporter Tret1-like isofo